MVAEVGASDREVPRPAWQVQPRARRPALPGARVAPAVEQDPGAVLRRYRLLAVGSDFAAAAIAVGFATLMRFGTDPGPAYLVLSLLAPALWVLAVAARRGYEARFLGTGPEEYRSVADATLVLFIVIAVASFVLKTDLSRGFIVGFLPLTFVATVLGRRQLRGWLYRKRLAGHGMHHVLVVGRSDTVTDLLEQFERDPGHGLVPVGVCVSGGSLDPARVGGVAVTTRTDTRSVLRTVDDLRADMVAVVADPELSGQALRRLAWELEERGVDLSCPRASSRSPARGSRSARWPDLSLLHVQRPAPAGERHVREGGVRQAARAAPPARALPRARGIAVAVEAHQPRAGALPADAGRRRRPRVHDAQVPLDGGGRRGACSTSSGAQTTATACCSR